MTTPSDRIPLDYPPESLDAVFRPKSMAVIGATPKPGTIGRQILHNLEAGELDPTGFPRLAEGEPGASAAGGSQLALSLGEPALCPEEREVLSQLRALDVNGTTPMDALLLLQRLAARLAGKGSS